MGSTLDPKSEQVPELAEAVTQTFLSSCLKLTHRTGQFISMPRAAVRMTDDHLQEEST
jgi:hypothetical protein